MGTPARRPDDHGTYRLRSAAHATRYLEQSGCSRSERRSA
jgi:hypothetical protein